MIRKSKKAKILCITLLCINLAVIWGNSLLPGEISGAFSRWVKELLGFDTGGPDGGHGLLRKLGHFTEFTCLGLLLSWLVRMHREKVSAHFLLPLTAGFLAACTDELIQCFVPDRGPGIKDVGIDTAGVSLGIFIIAVCMQIRIRKRSKKEMNV